MVGGEKFGKGGMEICVSCEVKPLVVALAGGETEAVPFGAVGGGEAYICLISESERGSEDRSVPRNSFAEWKESAELELGLRSGGGAESFFDLRRRGCREVEESLLGLLCGDGD
jgi:hypothetical protein